MILAIRTDKPEAEIYLLDDGGAIKAEYKWQAHKELSITILEKINLLLDQTGTGWDSVKGLIVFKGPGSFTGLRIGITVANAVSYSLHAPVTGTSGEDWLKAGVENLMTANMSTLVVPEYGGEANITTPRK